MWHSVDVARSRTRRARLELPRPGGEKAALARRFTRRLVAAYVVVATIGGLLAWRFGAHPPFWHEGAWIPASRLVSSSVSAMLGVAYAFAIVIGTRVSVARFAWARQLHDELSPVARRLGTGGIVAVAALSALGEELVFRGFLLENVGVLASTAIFGAIHQTRGPSRWTWAIWATAVGLGFALIYVATGSLVGPILAHALINGTNLVFLRSHAIEAGEAALRAGRGDMADATPQPAAPSAIDARAPSR
jgi:membrane protease YdiL (CAAX protease family)